jgi:hypothetical protein
MLLAGEGASLALWKGEMAIKLRRETKRHLEFCVCYGGRSHSFCEYDFALSTCSKRGTWVDFHIGLLSHPLTGNLFHAVSYLCSRLPLSREPSSTSLNRLLLRDRDDSDVDLIEAHALQQILRIRIHI